MKKRIALFLVPVIVITITFGSYVTAKALIGEILAGLDIAVGVTQGVESSQSYNDWYFNVYKPKWRESISQLWDKQGFIPNPIQAADWLGPDPIISAKEYLGFYNNTDPSNITDSEAEEQLYNMWNGNDINVSDDSFVVGGNLNQYLIWLSDEYKKDNGYKYLYGCSLQASQSLLGSNIFQMAEMLNNNHNSFLQIGTLGESSKVHVYHYNFGSSMIYGVLSQDYSADWKRIQLYEVKNENGVMHVNMWFPEDASICSVYEAVSPTALVDVSSNYNYPLKLGNNATFLDAYGCMQPQQSAGSNSWNGYPKIFSYGNNGIMWFSSLNDLNSYIENMGLGKYSYYTNNQVYSNWVNSSGDYTIDSSNSNNVDYSQVTNYIDNSYTENGSYPSLPDINNYITIANSPNNDNPNPDNPSGGGGTGGTATATANNEGINITVNNNHSLVIGGSTLSGNTVSGNGSGESGSGGIFDFLGQIGHTIGNFVKNIGQVLADIVTGLGEVVSSLLESIPTIFGDFLGALIGWLPTELQALITLSITAMILVGLIKLFRG